MKKIFGLAATVIMLLLFAPSAFAAIYEDEYGSWNYEEYTRYISITGYDETETVIVIPNTINGKPVTKIELLAFSECTTLTSITIPNSVTSIGYYAFFKCTSLTSLIIPDSVTYIGDCAFSLCSSLTSIIIPDSVVSIGDFVFSECTSLSSIIIPNSVTSIGDCAFSRCTSLTSIAIPNSVTFIGIGAFSGCTSLTSIAIPNSVTSIEYGAFSGCASLVSITVEEGNNSYASVDGVLFNKTTTDLIQYPIANERISYEIPNNVTSIGEFAFSNCASLTSITLPSSVTSIESSAIQGCSNLKSVIIPSTSVWFGDFVFDNCPKLTLYGVYDSPTHEYAVYHNIPFLGIGEKRIDIVFDGVTLEFDVTPIADENDVLAPYNVIATALGASANYDDGQQTLELRKGSVTLEFALNSETALKNGEEYALDLPPRLWIDAFMVPVTFVAESFGAQTVWDKDAEKFYIWLFDGVINVINLSPTQDVNVDSITTSAITDDKIDITAHLTETKSGTAMLVAGYKNGKMTNICKALSAGNTIALENVPISLFANEYKIIIWDDTTLTPYIEVVTNSNN